MTIAALAAMAVGTGLKIKADNERKSDMRKVQRRETERQEGIYREAEGNLVKNRDSYSRENVEQKMDAAAGERTAQYAMAEAAAPRVNEAAPGSAGTNQIINDAFSRALSDAKGEATEQGGLRAKLASMGDMLTTNAIENNRRTGKIGMMGSFSHGSANVMPLELQHQMSRARGADTWGGILQSFGGAMMGGGGAGTGATTGASTAASGAGAASAVDWTSLFSSNRSPNLGGG